MFVSKCVHHIAEIKILTHFLAYLIYQSEIEDK